MEIKRKYTGYIPDKIEAEHWVLGASILPQVVLRKDGQWLDYLPKGEDQKKLIETYNCTGFNTLHPIEILMWEQFGAIRDYSERFVGIIAGTRPPGNYAQVVCEAIRKMGVIKEELLPFDNTIDTIEKYYSPDPLPDNLIKEGKKWGVQYGFGHEWVFTSTHSLQERVQKMKQALQYSPLSTGVYAWQQDIDGLFKNKDNQENNHWTVIVGYVDKQHWICFDSYNPYVKHLAWDYPFGSTKRYSLTYIPQAVNDIVKNSSMIVNSEIYSTPQKVGILESIINFLKAYLSFLQ